MSGKPKEYWLNKFDTYSSRRSQKFRESVKKQLSSVDVDDYCNYCTALELLCDYSAATRDGKFALYGGNAWSRFWAGRWGTNHGNEVRQALSIVDKLPPEQQSMAKLMSEIKTQLGKKVLKKDGDLCRILEVINEKTGINIDLENQRSNQTYHTIVRGIDM